MLVKARVTSNRPSEWPPQHRSGVFYVCRAFRAAQLSGLLHGLVAQVDGGVGVILVQRLEALGQDEPRVALGALSLST